jgi:hypothetical protein
MHEVFLYHSIACTTYKCKSMKPGPCKVSLHDNESEHGNVKKTKKREGKEG